MGAPFDGVKLDARLEGKSYTATASSKTLHYYDFSHEINGNVVSFIGVSIYSEAIALGDKVTLWTEYYVPPLTAWKRYKKFAKTWNIFPKTEMKDILFPTQPTNGVRVVIEYDNQSGSDVNFAVNFYNFVDEQTVNTATAAEGYDW